MIFEWLSNVIDHFEGLSEIWLVKKDSLYPGGAPGAHAMHISDVALQTDSSRQTGANIWMCLSPQGLSAVVRA